MVQSIRKIGNSNGVIIPKSMLLSCGISDEVEMEIIGEAIVLKSVKQHPRDGWEKAFAAEKEVPESDMFEDMKNDFDSKEWNW
jgi:antitoxin MazE